jgi:hypothetical protein
MQNNQSLHNDFIVLPEFRIVFLQKLVQTLFEKKSRWDVIYFRNISNNSDNLKVLVEVLDGQCRSWKQYSTPFDSPFLIPTGDWEDYLAGRTRRTRKSLNNIRNRICSSGKISVKKIRSWEEFLSCKEELFALAQQSWSESAGDSMGSPINRDYFESLTFAAASKGWLSIWALYLDGKMIAVEFHLKAYGREHALRSHYHPAFASLSPGTCLEMAILEHVFREPDRVQLYDFCGAFDKYKKKWTESFVPHCDIHIFNDQLYSKYVRFHETKLVPGAKKAIQYAKQLRQSN